MSLCGGESFLQVSGLCGTPFLSYLLKRSTQIYRAQCEDAILVSFRGTPTWRPEINEKHLELTFATRAITFLCHELVYILFKLPKIVRADLFSDETGLSRRHHDVTHWGAISNSRCCIINTKDDPELETCENVYI